MPRIPQVITFPNDLNGLSVLPGRRLPGAGRIEIAAEGVDQKTREAWERRLNARYYACGCAEGSIGLVLGVAVCGLALAFGSRDGWSILGLVAVPLAGLVIGKIAGLIRAEARFKETVAEIREQWGEVALPEPDDWVCG